MAIQNQLITTSAVDLITVPALTTYASVAIVFCNYGTEDETITVNAIPSGETADNSNIIMKSFVLPAGNSYVFDTKLILGAGDKVSVTGVVSGLANATVTYMTL